ncbi:MAG: hypothetical protein ACI8RD_002292 [Bacillariaceae sp.]|jgi:hypothetical protein
MQVYIGMIEIGIGDYKEKMTVKNMEDLKMQHDAPSSTVL